MITRRYAAAAAFTVLCAWAVSAAGQTTEGDAVSGEAVELAPIVVTGEGQAAEAGSVVIDSVDLERLGPQDLQDVFKTTPGVQVGGSTPLAQKVYVQGIEETNLSVTIDGARQNNKIFHHSGTTYIDPDLLKGVRVDPGVAPADAGPGALAGSIAYETKDVDDLLAPGDNFGGVIGAEYVSNGDVFSTDVSLFGRHGGVEALGYFKIANGGNFEAGNGDEVIGSGTEIVSGLGKIAYQHETGYRIEGSYESVDDSDTRPWRANFVLGDQTRPYILHRQNWVVSFEDATPEGLFNLHGRIAHSSTDLEASIFEPSFGFTESLSGMLANEANFDIGAVNLGVDFYADSSSGRFPAFNPDGDLTEQAKNIGVFGQARLEPVDWARLSFGGRGDFQEFEGVDGSTSNNSGLSGNVSGEVDVTPFLTASAGYSHVFGGVALGEPYIFNPLWEYPAGGIEPSTADNVFVGLAFDGEGVSSSLAGFTITGKLFRTDIDNARNEIFDANGSGVAGAPGSDNTSDVVSKGFEVGAGYAWDNGLFRVAYANIDTEVDGLPADTDSGQYLAVPIGQILTAEAAYTLESTGLTVGADAQFVFEEQGYFRGAPQAKLQAYEVVNAFVSYTPPGLDQLTLRAEVNNLFDELYADRGSYGGEFAGTVPLYEPGRSLSLSSKLRF